MHKITKKNKITTVASVTLLTGLFAFSAQASIPSVQTYSVSTVSGSCAMLNGYSSANNQWFEIKELNKNESPRTVYSSGGSYGYSWSFGYNNTSSSGAFKAEVTKLIPDTTYTFRAVAQNSDGIAYGTEGRFTTRPSNYQKDQQGDSFSGCSSYVPMTTNENPNINTNTGYVAPDNSSYSYNTQISTSNAGNSSYQNVVTQNPIGISNTGAVLRANVFPTQSVAEYGKFLWGKTPNLGNTTPRIFLGSGSSALNLTQEITGLTPGTTYYYKPVVDNTYGSTEGVVLSFTTTGTVSAGQGGWSNYNSDETGYYSTPIAGHTSNTNNPSIVNSTGDSNSANLDVMGQNNTASAALAGGSNSIFPKTFADWFAIMTIFFISFLSYIVWRYYTMRKEDDINELPETLAVFDFEIPKKINKKL